MLPLMTVKNYEALLHQQLAPLLEHEGFTLLPALKQFRKPTMAGFVNIIVSFSAYQHETWLEVHLGNRIDEVEKLAQQYLNNLTDYRSECNTLIVSVGRLKHLRYFRYRICTPDDLNDAADNIRQFMLAEGLPFLNELTHLKKTEKLLNKNPQKTCPYLYNQVHRCFKGAIAACLVQSPRLEQLLEMYRHGLKVRGAPALVQQRYAKLAELLPVYSLN